MTNKEYIVRNHIDDLLESITEYGCCDFCKTVGCKEYCRHNYTQNSCEETFKLWLSMERNSLNLNVGEIVEVKLPTDTQLCYYAGSELGIHYFTNSKKTCNQIKEIGLKSISKADLIVLPNCDLPLYVSKVGDSNA